LPYRITITQRAKSQLQSFRAREQRIIASGLKSHLQESPAQPSHAVKVLRPNPFASYELRLGDVRVLYNVIEEASEVKVVLVGRKVGNTLIVEGQEFREHQGDLPE
jgi:mRNA-degrading endonuclease RelE of RelBE toxin-antitoxin system